MDADVANLYRGFATYNPAVTVTPVGGPLFSASQTIEFRVSVDSAAFPAWTSADVYDGAFKLGTVNKGESMSVYAVRPWGGRGVTAIARDASGNERTSIPQPFVVNKNSAPAWNNGSGNFLWNTTSANWGGAVWTPGADAVFGATGVGTVTVSGTQTLADSLTALCFDTAGYKLMGGPLALPAYPGISGFNVNADAEIASVITGSGNLNKTGAGTLTLTGSNTHTGVTSVKAGSLKLGNGGNLGNTQVFPGATVAIAQNANGTTNALNGYLLLWLGANLTMADGYTSTFKVDWASLSAQSGASPALTFDVASTNQTSDRLAIVGTASIFTNALPTIVANFLAAPSDSTKTYTLITAASGLGGAAKFKLATNNVTIGGNPYHTSLATSTDTSVILSFEAGWTFSPFYWQGSIDGSWKSQNSGTQHRNFTSEAAGAANTLELPSSVSNVFMTANSASNLTTTLDQAFTINGLTFVGTGSSNTAGSSIGAGAGGTLQINGGGITVNAGSGANTISAPVTLGAAQSWINNSSNMLTVGTGIVNNGGFLLTVAGSGNTTISGAMIGNGSLTQSGSGTLTLSGSNNYTGATTINAGTLSVSTDANLGSGGGIALNGGTLQTTGSSAFSSSKAIVAGNFTIDASNAAGTTLTGLLTGGGLRKTGNGSLTFSSGTGNTDTLVGLNIESGAVNLTSGNFRVTGSGWQLPTQGLWLNGGNLNVAGGALRTTGDVVNQNGTLTVSSGTYTSSGWLINAWGGTATTTVSGGLLDIDGGLRVSQGIGTVNLDGGTVKLRVFQCGTAGSTGTVNFNGATVVAKANVTGFTQTLYTTYIVKSGGAIIDTAGFNITAAADLLAGSPSGGLTKNGAGTLTLSGNSTYTGLTTITAGTLQLNGSITGNLTVQAGGTLTGSGTITQNLIVASGGTTQFSGGTFTVNGSITNNGTLILSNGAQITGYSSFINNGVIINPTSAGAVTVSRSGNTVSVSIPSNTGYAYQLQYSSELSGESFTNVGAPQLGTGTTLVFTDPNATTSSGVYKVVAFITQSINFPSIPTQTYGVSPFSLGATSTSGLQISYSTTSTSLISISSNTMTVLGAGTATIVASQAGNSNYMAATSVTNQLVISKATQTISPFAIIPTQTYATNMTMIITPPTANSSQPVSVKVLSGPATISGNTLTLTGTGTVVLAADQSGNANYLAAPEITTSFTVEAAATPVNVNVFFMDGSTVIRKRH